MKTPPRTEPQPASAKTRLILADSHASIRDLLRETIGRDETYEVTGEAHTGIEALRMCRDLKPDILILEEPAGDRRAGSHR